MNLLLLSADEVRAEGDVVVTGRRARHLVEVLRVEPGRTLRCGVVDGPFGEGTVTALSERGVHLACVFEGVTPALPPHVLMLAVPRPKVLRRVVEDATAMGYGTIVLVRTWRTDRAHVEAADPEALLPHLWAGLEQGRRTRVPRVLVEPLFRPFVEDRFAALTQGTTAFVAHPEARVALADARSAPYTLCVGPERGFTPYEVELLAAQGALPVHAGAHPLRVETAVAFLTGQLSTPRDVTPPA